MKKFVFFILIVFLNAADLNFIVGRPLIDKSVNNIINLSINKGFVSQITDIVNRLREDDKSIDIKYLNPYVYNYNRFNSYKIADIKTEEDIESFIKKVNQNFSKTNANVVTKKVSLDNLDIKNLVININKSDFKRMNKQFIKKYNYDQQFKSILLNIKNYYHCEDKICVSFYRYIIQNGKYYINYIYKQKPDLFFYENFIPYKKGRRYFMDIIVYVISIDEDGEPSFEYQTIKDFEWLRNYRFISAQTGMTIRELINKKTGVNIR